MIDNWFYVIPNIFFGLLLFLAIGKIKQNIVAYGRNYLPFFIISLYFLSASLIYFVEPKIWYPNFHESSYSFLNFCIYSFFLFLYLLPALYVKPLSSNYFIKKSKIITGMMFVMSILGIYSLVYQMPYAIEGFLMGSDNLRYIMNNEGLFLLPKSSFTTLAVGISYFYLFYIAFFFIAIIQKRNILIKTSLLVGSISYIVSGLTFGTRDVFVFYILGFLFVYLFFANLLSELIRLKIKSIYTLFIIVFIGIILLFSYQRFSDRKEKHALAYGTVGYIAQQPFVFSETIEQQTKFYEGDLRFPIFKSFLGETKEIKRTIQYEWSFGTFIKDFYSEGGFPFLIIITSIFVPLFLVKIRNSHKNNFYRNLIINLFYFQFISMGIFYFNLGSRAGNIYMIILLLFYFTTYFTYGKKYEKTIK